MDLRSVANSVSCVVNPNVTVQVQASTGYTIGAGLRQVPTYATAVTGPAQFQAVNSSDLKLMDGVNIQGVLRSVYLRGSLAAVVRPNGTGGDIIVDPSGETWLVVKVVESWPTWTKAIIQLQGGE